MREVNKFFEGANEEKCDWAKGERWNLNTSLRDTNENKVIGMTKFRED